MISAIEVWKKLKDVGGKWWDTYTQSLAEANERIAYGELHGAFTAAKTAAAAAQELEKEPWASVLQAMDMLDIAAIQSGVPHLELAGAAGLATERLLRIVSNPKAAKLLGKLSRLYERGMSAVDRFPELDSNRTVLEKLDRLENAIELEVPEAESMVDEVASAFKRMERTAEVTSKTVPLTETVQVATATAAKETLLEKRLRSAGELLAEVEPERLTDIIAANPVNAWHLAEPYNAWRTGKTSSDQSHSLARILSIKPVQTTWDRFKQVAFSTVRYLMPKDVSEKAVGYMLDEWPELPAEDLRDILVYNAKYGNRPKLRTMLEEDPARFRQIFGRAYTRALRDAYANISR